MERIAAKQFLGKWGGSDGEGRLAQQRNSKGKTGGKRAKRTSEAEKDPRALHTQYKTNGVI